MTKPQIWVAAFLFLFLVLFMLGRLTKKDEMPEEMKTGNPVPQTEMSSQELTAEQLIDRVGCMNCHGRSLTGTKEGPTLVGVSQYWTRDKLINYLRNPVSFMDADRFKAYKQQYPDKIMPSFNNINIKDLGKIADYLMNLK